MPDKNYYIVLPSGKGRAYSETEFNSQNVQNFITDESTGAAVFEQAAYSPGEDGDASDLYIISSNGKSRNYTADQFKSENVQGWLGSNPDATVARYRRHAAQPVPAEEPQVAPEENVDWRRSMAAQAQSVVNGANAAQQRVAGAAAPTTEEILGQFNTRPEDRLRREVNYAASLSPEELEAYQAQRMQNIENDRQDREMGRLEEIVGNKKDYSRAERKEAKEQLSAIVEGEQWQSRIKEQDDEALAYRDEWLGKASETSDMLNRYNPQLGQMVYVNISPESRTYEQAAKLAEDTHNILTAGSRYDATNAFVNYAKGHIDTFSNKDFWTMGLSEIERNLNLRGAFDKIVNKFGDLRDLSDEKIDQVLSDDEKALMKAFFMNAQAQSMRAGELSSGYKAGQTSAESLGFMAQFLLTGGVAGAAGSGVDTASKALTKWIVRNIKTKALRNAAEIGNRVLTKAVAKPLVESLVRTPIMTSTYANISEGLTDINDQGTFDKTSKVLFDKTLDSVIENWSESFGDSIQGGAAALAKSLGWASSKAIGKTNFYEFTRKMLESAPTEVLKEAGFNGLISEMAEEWAGNAARVATGLMSKEEFKDFASLDQQLEMAAGFGLMSGIGLIKSASYAAAKANRYNELSSKMREVLGRAGASEDEINGIFDKKYTTPKQVAEELKPYLTDIVRGKYDEGLKAEDYSTTLEFATEMGVNAVAQEAQAIAKQEARDSMQQQIQEQYGEFWHTENFGKEAIPMETVTAITDAEGNTFYQVGESDGKLALRGIDGKPRFMDAEDVDAKVESGEYSIVKNQPIHKFLDDVIEQQRAANEQQRMQSETQAATANVKRRAELGSTINIGTEEEPMNAIVVQNKPDGVILQKPDGTYVQKSWSEIGNAIQAPIESKTDAEIEAESNAALVKAEQQRRGANASFAGRNFGFNGNSYRFVRAFEVPYTQEDGTLMLKFTAQNTETGESEELEMPYEELSAQIDAEPAAEAAAEAAEAEAAPEVQDNTPRDFRGEPLPLMQDEDGVTIVDENALWNKDPEAWAKYNDQETHDGGMASFSYITTIAMPKLQAARDQLQGSLATEGNFDTRRALKKQIAAIDGRLAQLESVANNYRNQFMAEAQRQRERLQEEQKNATLAHANELQQFLDSIADMPVSVVTLDNVVETLRADGVSEGSISKVEAEIEKVKALHMMMSGFHVPGKVYVVAEFNSNTAAAEITYKHERQHEENSIDPSVVDVIANSYDEDALSGMVKGLSNSNNYEGESAAVLADEILAFGLEDATDDGLNIERLQAAGLDENLINILEYVRTRRNDSLRGADRRSTLQSENSEEPVSNDGEAQNGEPDQMGELQGGLDGGSSEEAQTAAGAEGVAPEIDPDLANTGETTLNGQPISSEEGAVQFSIRTESALKRALRHFAEDKEAKRLGWLTSQINDIVNETSDLIEMLHAGIAGDPNYDEFAKKDPTIRVDWRDGAEKPTVTWVRNNIEYKYDMSADTFCINNEGLETILASPVMADIMITLAQRNYNPKEADEGHRSGFKSDDYLLLYETLRDMGFVVPCKGCFDAAARFKMLPSVAQSFVELVNKTIDERNAGPEAFDASVRAMQSKNRDINGFPTGAANKADAIRIGVAGDKLTKHINWTQLMSAKGQTQALADWGGIFRAWQRTGAGRPKDKLTPEPYTGQIMESTSTIIAPYGETTPSFRDLEVNVGTGLRRNSHSEFRATLAVDEIQFMRDAWLKKLCVFKYMKELDDVRLFHNFGVKFNMSTFPAWVNGGVAAGLDANGEYALAEESVGGREYPYIGEDGRTHYDGYKGFEEAKSYINKDCSLSSIAMSVPHLIKLMTDVPTPLDWSGTFGSLIPFHASGATAASLAMQGLGKARALGVGHAFMDEAFTDYDKGVTNFEDVQNDRYGEGWIVISGKDAGKSATGHKLEYPQAAVLRNEDLGVTYFKSPAAYKKFGGMQDFGKIAGEFYTLDSENNQIAHPLVIDYNDKVREIGSDYAYKEAADFYINEMRKIGFLPRFDFDVPEDKFLEMCEVAKVDPMNPKLGWRGAGNSWSPCDADTYYSLFCDYGMTDPATGKLSPHRPVLDGQTDADAFRNALPENYLDIIKDGLKRYTERKAAEDSMINDAVREFCRREVELGRLSQEDVDAILQAHEGDFSDLEGNPVQRELTSSQRRMLEFIGEAPAEDGPRFSVKNDKFNAELDAYKEGKHTGDFHLGTPNSLLRAAGLKDSDIKMKTKTLKEHLEKHNLSVDDLKGLVDALDNPLMIYEWGSKNRSLIVITELTTSDGRKITSAFKMRDGYLENEVASIHGKDITHMLMDMVERESDFGANKLKYVNKEKTLDWLGLVPPKGTAALTDQESSVAKIINSFDNATILRDAEYMKAYEAGDEQKAIEMISDAFLAAYPNNKLGARSFYKGKNGEWGNQVAGYFTDDFEFANHYGSGDVKECFLVMENPFEYDFKESGSDGDFEGLDGEIRDTRGVMQDADAEAREKGLKPYDGYILRNVGEGYGPGSYVVDDYIVKDPLQVKSAEPFTFDDNGELIPLSQRFNTESDDIRFRTAYHGTAAEFKAFDLSHVGEGEGYDAHGYGIYVTTDKETGRKYAEIAKRVDVDSVEEPTDEESRAYLEKEQFAESAKFWLDDDESGHTRDTKLDDVDLDQYHTHKRLKDSPIEHDVWDFYNQSKTIGGLLDNFERLEAPQKVRSYRDAQSRLAEETHEFLYTVDIPDNNGHNYIDEMKTLEKQDRRRVAKQVRQLPDDALQRDTHGPNWLPNGVETLANVIEREPYAGLDIRNRLVDALGTEKAASELLSKAGFVGYTYDGRIDGECAVIFNADDIKIDDAVRFRMTESVKQEFAPRFSAIREEYEQAKKEILGHDGKFTHEEWVEHKDDLVRIGKERDAKLQALQEEYAKAYDEAEAEDQRNAPKYDTVGEPDAERGKALFDAAKETFGTTTNFMEAGYIVPDGSMIDLSGKNEGGEAGRRMHDHRDVNAIINDRKYSTVTEYMDDFINEGAIRIAPEVGLVTIANMPTKEQKEILRNYLYRYSGEGVEVELIKNTKTAAHPTYRPRTAPSRILEDIERYFDQGVIPVGNEPMFRTSAETLEKIWNSEFDSAYLRKLDKKVDEIYNENATINRLESNPGTVRGLKEGSRVHVAASLIVQRGGSTSSETPLYDDAVGYQSLIQEQLIESWARHNGLWHDDVTSYLTDKYGKMVAYGNESHVYKDGNEAVKEWRTGRYESLQLALDRVTIHNTIFPETAMVVEGFGRTSSGEFCVIIRQPYIEGRKLDEGDVVTFMDSRGFDELTNEHSPERHTDFANADFYIADMHDANVIVHTDSDGKLHYYVLDCVAYLNTPGLGLGGTFEIGSPEEWSSGSEDDWKYPVNVGANSDIRYRVIPGGESMAERTYRETGAFSFTGSEKINSIDDVAFIFRELQNHATENSFLVFVKDGVPTILHTGIGSVASTVIDMSAAVAGYNDFNPDVVYMVHNHPSGNLYASQADKDMLEKLSNIVGGTPVEGVILDTVSGNYGVFDKWVDTKRQMPESGDEYPVKVLSFDRQVFDKDFRSQMAERKISGAGDVAAFLSAHRLGEGNKLGALLLNHSNIIVANLVTNDNYLKEENAKEIARHVANVAAHNAATSTILFGNFNFTPDSLLAFKKGLGAASGDELSVLDVVQFDKDGDYRSVAEGNLKGHLGSVMYRIEDRRPDESVYDYLVKSLDEIKRDYRNIARADAIKRTTNEENDAEYNEEKDAIVYYSNDIITKFDEVIDSFFHENAHAAIAKGIIDADLGGRTLKNLLELGYITEDRYNDILNRVVQEYGEDRAGNEVTTWLLSSIMRSPNKERIIGDLTEDLTKQYYAYGQAISRRGPKDSSGNSSKNGRVNSTQAVLEGNGNEGASGNARNDQEVPETSAGISAEELGDGEVRFSVRTKPAPEKTGIGYKVFYLKDGKLYPPMVANPNREATPVGVWLDADAAPIAGTSKTGRPQVKAGGKGTQGGSGQLAYRPGWHLGTIPYAIQFNRKDENGEKTLFPKDFVWAEVEYAADNNYQQEAEAEGVNPSGKFQHSLAGLKRLPEDGYYMYRTNPNPETDPWIITGAMKVNKVLTRAEVDALVREAGREPQRVEGDKTGVVSFNDRPAAEIPADRTGSVMMRVFRQTPEATRRAIIDEAMDTDLNFANATARHYGDLAMKSELTDEEKNEVKAAADVMASELGRNGMSNNEAIMAMWDAGNRDGSVLSEMRRSIAQRNLGLTQAEQQAVEDVDTQIRFRNAMREFTGSAANFYNRNVNYFWNMMDEAYVDMNKSVNIMVDAIEKMTGRKAEGWEDIRLALNQLSSKNLADKENYMKDFYQPLMQSVFDIINWSHKSYEDVERYMMLKHGLERNDVFAKRDAIEYYKKKRDEHIASIKENVAKALQAKIDQIKADFPTDEWDIEIAAAKDAAAADREAKIKEANTYFENRKEDIENSRYDRTADEELARAEEDYKSMKRQIAGLKDSGAISAEEASSQYDQNLPLRKKVAYGYL